MARIAQEMRVSPEVMARYEPVIGLEVHAQLKTKTKAFCGCSTRFGDAPNKNTCPVCLGLPGALPVLNRKAVELAVRASLALQARIHERSRFARKNYFYPDLPKGYQISMYELPLATGGALEIEIEGRAKKIGITRLHMEEDAAKNLHEGFPDSDKWSYIDFNRGGVPLVEIVSEPDIRTPSEAYQYLNTLKQVLEYTDVSDCNMEEGSLRCDANVSVRPRGEAKFGTKVEVKNLNSFRYLSHALEFEIERHVGVLESGGSVTQETRLWNVAGGRTESMRSKEFAHDYRYFPDPDLLPVMVMEPLVAEVRRGMPELPAAKVARFVEAYGIAAYDAGVLTENQNLADYYESVVRAGAEAKITASWMQRIRHLAETAPNVLDNISYKHGPLAAEKVARLIQLVAENKITAANARDVLKKMFETGKNAEEIIASEGLAQISDAGSIETVARQVVTKSPENVAKYKSGNEGVFKFFVGQVMKETRGQANPQIVNEILKRVLAEA
jgi:aspartyl-tRNA(Asn)/glutamyl-tRNA(Gln) amidotransferase subunit B